MKDAKRYCLILLFLFFSLSLEAQNFVKGTVKDADNAPIAGASVVLYPQDRPENAEGCISDTEGLFLMKDISQGEYRLEISCVGYLSFSCMLFVDKPVDIGDVVLKIESQSLGEVVVTAQPETQLVGSSLVSQISGSSLQNVGNALDVLRQLPMITVSNSEVDVTGKGTPIIFINGRPLRDNTELQSLQSADIKTVELVLAPGAQYESTANAVIKITTRKNFLKGISASNEAEVHVRRKCSVSDLLDVSYYGDKWEIFGTGNFMHNNSLITGSTEKRLIYKGEPTIVGSTLNNTYPENQAFGKIGFNFSEGSQSLGAYYRFSHADSDFLNCGSEWLNQEKPVLRNIATDGKERNHLVSLYYDNTFSEKYHLHFDGNFRGDSSNKSSETSYPAVERVPVNSTQEQTSELWAGKLYLEFPLAEGMFSVGTQDSYTHTMLDYKMLNSEVGTYIPSSLTDARQTSLSAFATWARQFGAFSLSAGLRYEFVDYLFTVNGKKDSDVSRRDNLLTPDIALGYSFGKSSMLSLSYRMITMKPSYSQLTGGLVYAGEHEIEGGNPMLRDEKRHDVQLFGQWNDFLFQVDCIRSLDSYAFVKQLYPANSLQLLMSPMNVDVTELSAFLVWSRAIGAWMPNATLGVVKPWMKLGSDRYDQPQFIYSFQNTVSLPWELTLMANVRGQSSGDVRTNHFAASWFVMDASVRKTFLNKSLAVKITATDIFNTRNNDWSMNTYGVYMYKHQRYDSRGISISVQYKFRPKKSRYKGQSAAEAEMNRL